MTLTSERVIALCGAVALAGNVISSVLVLYGGGGGLSFPFTCSLMTQGKTDLAPSGLSARVGGRCGRSSAACERFSICSGAGFLRVSTSARLCIHDTHYPTQDALESSSPFDPVEVYHSFLFPRRNCLNFVQKASIGA